jgi:hypothetical protein
LASEDHISFLKHIKRKVVSKAREVPTTRQKMTLDVSKVGFGSSYLATTSFFNPFIPRSPVHSIESSSDFSGDDSDNESNSLSTTSSGTRGDDSNMGFDIPMTFLSINTIITIESHSRNC